MRDRRNGGHFNDRNKQREKWKGNQMTSQPLIFMGMHAPCEYNNPFTPRNAYSCGRAKGAFVDQSLARVFLEDSRERHGVPLRHSYLPPCKYACTCAYIAHIAHMYLYTNAYIGCIIKRNCVVAELSSKFQRYFGKNFTFSFI